MNITRSSVKIFLANGSNALIGFVGVALFARILGAHDLGVFFLFQALLGMLALPADVGVGDAVEKRISEGMPSGDVYATGLALKLLLVGVVVGLVLLFRDPINGYLGADLAWLLALGLVFQEFGHMGIKLLSGELRVGETSELYLVKQFSLVALGSLLLVLEFGVEGLVYALLVGFLLQTAWGIYKTSTSLGRPSVAHARSIIAYSKYGFVGSIGGYFYEWMDVAIIGLILTQSAVSAYEIAWRIAGISMLFSYAVGTTIFPQISQWAAEGAIGRIEGLLPRAITAAVLLVLPAFFGVAVLSKDILRLLFGPEYVVAWLTLIVLTGEKLVQSVHIMLSQSLEGIDRPDLAARATVVAVVVNLVLNLVLIAEFGILGAAFATATSFGINTAISAHYVGRHMDIQLPYGNVAQCLVASVGMTLVLLGGRSMVPVDSVFVLLGFVAVGAATYAAIVVAFPGLRAELRAGVRALTT